MKKLFCPGPVNVSIDIAELAMNTNIGHRSNEFEEIFKNVRYTTLRMLNATEKNYYCLPITGSATLANEMCIASAFKKTDKVLLLSNGVFGDRLKSILSLYNISFEEYHVDFAFDAEAVKEILGKNEFTWIVMVHHETSTGILNNINEMAEIAHNSKARIFVDAVSSAAADYIDLAKTNIDIIVTTSGKAIGAYPGVGLICIRKDCYNSIDHSVGSDYLNLWTNIDFAEEYGQPLHTPSIPLFVALDAQMHKLMVNPSYNHDRYMKMNSYIRKEMIKLGLKPYLDENIDRSITLTSFLLDPQIYNLDKFISNMNDRGFVLYIGKGKLKELGLFQIANMGDLRMTDCYELVESIQKEIESGDSKWI